MDFGKLMQAQISKSSTTTTPATTASSKHSKRLQAEEAREAAYRAEQAALESERLQKAEKKRRLAEEESARHEERLAKKRRVAEESKKRQQEQDEQTEKDRRKRLGLPEMPSKTQLDEEEAKDALKGEGKVDIEDGLLRAMLRDIDQPTVVFGEGHGERLKRYRKLEKARARAVAKRSDQPVPTTLEPIAKDEIQIDEKVPPPTNVEGRALLARQLASWFNIVLFEWGKALASRDVEQQSSFAGKAASNSHIQALEHLKPLFRKFEKLSTDASVLPDDLLSPMADIVNKAQQRRYVHANDVYLQLSIGKAAWPIGVTMVGIHERSAREKLFEDKSKAHIMSDEETRKILQSIKRCLSFAQTKWPPENLDQLMG